jgi:putative transposase
VRQYIGRGMKRDQALSICQVSKDQFYYKVIGGKQGRKASKYTNRIVDGVEVLHSNRAVIGYIRSKYDDPKVDYGYHKMTAELQLDGFVINHKKVYRLMQNGQLLRPKPLKDKKCWVKYRKLVPEGPWNIFEMDIKQVWMKLECRYMFVLTIIDVFTRIVLEQTSGYSMTQEQVQSAWKRVITNYLEPYSISTSDLYIEVRSDNGPQFCAIKLNNFFSLNGFHRTFTHPYTPQENGHVESYHAILANAMKSCDFDRRSDFEVWRITFLEFYNYRRIHSSITKLPPKTFLDQWYRGNIKIVKNPNVAREAKIVLAIPRNTVERVVPAGNGN